MKKRFLVALVTLVMVCGTIGLTACDNTKFGEVNLANSMAIYGAIEDYSVAGEDATIKAKVKIAQDKDAFMEVTAVIAPTTTGEGDEATTADTFKTITVAITGADKAPYETALSATAEESEVEYNNPKNLEGQAIRIMRTGRTVANATSSSYDFATAIEDADDNNAVGIASAEAMEQIVGYYRFAKIAKDTFGGLTVKANVVEVSSTYTSNVELFDNKTNDPAVEVTNVWEMENSYLIVATSSSSSHDQKIAVMLQINKADNKIINAITPYYHVSEYHGGAVNYINALNDNLNALKGVEIKDNFAQKGEEGSITEITTSATLTTNVITNAVNVIGNYYNTVIKTA